MSQADWAEPFTSLGVLGKRLGVASHTLPSCNSGLLAAEKQKEASRQGYTHGQRPWVGGIFKELGKGWRAGRMQSEGLLVGGGWQMGCRPCL